ncbi:MAG: alpha/beta hydrolase [Chitinophagaceae bacterium]
MKKIFFSLFFSSSLIMVKAQQEIPLYNGIIPGSRPCSMKETNPAPGRIASVVNPTLTIFLPEKPDSFKTSVLIFPGGGYARLAMDHEGYDVAKELNKYGIAGFVVKYRLPNDSCMVHKENGPLQDAEQAIKIVREHAAEWNINPSKVGIMGFSAGGHLASSLGTKFSQVLVENAGNIILRPDFMILGYPVISFNDSMAHKGSRDNLIGKNAGPEKITAFSNELQITPQTSPTFLVHAADDKTVPVQNSIVFYQTLLLNKVPAEMHLYQLGGHGFGMNNSTTADKWLPQAIHWIASNKWMKGDVKN